MHKHTTTTTNPWPVVTNLHYAMHTAAESVAPDLDVKVRLAFAEDHEPSQQPVASPPLSKSDAHPEAQNEQPTLQDTSTADEMGLFDDKKARRKKRKQAKMAARILAKQTRLVFPALQVPSALPPDEAPENKPGETNAGEKKKSSRSEAARLKREAAAAKKLSKNSFKKHQTYLEKQAARKARQEVGGEVETSDTIVAADREEGTAFSVEEELRIAEGRKERALAERAMRREKQSKEKERLKEQAGQERERERMSKMPLWAIQKEALKKKFPDGWRPHKRLSPDALNGIRALNQQFPDMFTTAVLAQKFEVSPEAIRRILRTKWAPRTEEEDADRHRRWKKRGEAIWEKYAELGKKPPKKWRDAGIAMKSWGGLEPEAWDGEEEGIVQGDGWRRPRQEDLRERHSEEDEFDEVEVGKARRLKAQRRLAENLM